MNQKLNFYIAKKFFINFALVSICICLLLGMINIFELLDQASGIEISFVKILFMDALLIPKFIEDITIFLVMLASMITLFGLSIRSEITVMRASGLSLWQILAPIAVSSFILGIFFVLIFNPISISASKKFTQIQQQFITKTQVNALEPRDGIWLKQDNILNEQEDIIIRATSMNRETLQMNGVNLWFFDKDYSFYKKLDVREMFFKEGSWHLKDVIINDDKNINKKIGDLAVATDLKAEFITKKVLNNFEDVRLFSVYELPGLIANLKDSGFSPKKFTAYLNSLLSKPFLFIAMALMAAFFAINNVRSKNNILFFVLGIVTGLVFYIALVIFNALGSSGIVPIFITTWMIGIILIAISMLLIFRKEIVN